MTGWRCDDALQVTLSMAETGADVHSSAGIEPGPVVIPSVPPVNPSLLRVVQNFAVEVGTVQGQGNHEVQSLRFTWTLPDDSTITAVRFFYVVGVDPTGDVTIFEDDTIDVERGEYVTTTNVQPDRFKTFTHERRPR